MIVTRGYYSSSTAQHWEIWDGPRQRESLDWVAAEFANLRAVVSLGGGSRELTLATTIAAHAAIMSWPLQRFEPVAWAEEILPAVVEADLAQLPRLYVAASLCLYGGRPDVGVAYAEEAERLESDPRYDPFVDGWSGVLQALAHLFGGRIDRRVEICCRLGDTAGLRPGDRPLWPDLGVACRRTFRRGDGHRRRNGRCRSPVRQPVLDRVGTGGYGRAFAETEPLRALHALREGLDYADTHRLGFWQANLAQDAARLEAIHGELDDALALFSAGINSFHRAGNVVFLAATFASLAVFFDRFEHPEVAATIYGASTRQPSIGLVPRLSDVVEHLRSVLGDATFETCVQTGSFDGHRRIRSLRAGTDPPRGAQPSRFRGSTATLSQRSPVARRMTNVVANGADVRSWSCPPAS